MCQSITLWYTFSKSGEVVDIGRLCFNFQQCDISSQWRNGWNGLWRYVEYQNEISARFESISKMWLGSKPDFSRIAGIAIISLTARGLCKGHRPPGQPSGGGGFRAGLETVEPTNANQSQTLLCGLLDGESSRQQGLPFLLPTR